MLIVYIISKFSGQQTICKGLGKSNYIWIFDDGSVDSTVYVPVPSSPNYFEMQIRNSTCKYITIYLKPKDSIFLIVLH